MRQVINVLKLRGPARPWFAALLQSSLGTGAGYIALLLLAYDRYRSPWAITAVLMADLAPAMLLGPLFGAVADRFSRRWCAVGADLLRAVAFAGVALSGSIELTVAFAALAGVGTGLFTVSALAGLPSLVDDERLPAATALYGAVTDTGYLAGPGLAALAFLAVGPETLLGVNAATFAVSAAVLASIDFGRVTGVPAGRRESLVRDALGGIRATMRTEGVRTIVIASAFALFCGGLLNVVELLLATGELGVGRTGFALLVGAFGAGFIAGSLSGSSGGGRTRLQRRYLGGLVVTAGGLAATGLAPTFATALFAFAATGLGNGLVLVYERLLIQSLVSDAFTARVFGVKDSLGSWAFAAAFATAGALVGAVGSRTVLLIAAALAGGVAAVAAVALRRAEPSVAVTRRGPAAAVRS